MSGQDPQGYYAKYQQAKQGQHLRKNPPAHPPRSKKQTPQFEEEKFDSSNSLSGDPDQDFRQKKRETDDLPRKKSNKNSVRNQMKSVDREESNSDDQQRNSKRRQGSQREKKKKPSSSRKQYKDEAGLQKRQQSNYSSQSEVEQRKGFSQKEKHERSKEVQPLEKGKQPRMAKDKHRQQQPSKGQQEEEEEEEIVVNEDMNAEDFISKNFRFANDSEQEESYYDQEEEGSESENSYGFHHVAEEDIEEDNSDSYSDRDIQHRHPVEFAKSHMQKIEEDMHRMHERHVKLMREMDDNYKMIEQETQEYYIEFLHKWKEVAKNKISQYRKAIEQLAHEKEALAKSKDYEIETLKEKLEYLNKDNAKDMRDLLDQISEMQSFQNRQNEELQSKEREKQNLKSKLEEKDKAAFSFESELRALQEKMKKNEEELNTELEQQAIGYKVQIEQLELEVQKMSKEKLEQIKEKSDAQRKVEKLEQQLKGMDSSQNKQINIKQIIGRQGGVIINKVPASSENGRNSQAPQNKAILDTSGQSVQKVFFKKDQIQIQRLQNQNKPVIKSIGRGTNSSLISQVPTSLELSQGYQSQQHQTELKAKKEELSLYYQQKMQKIQDEYAPLALEVQAWKKELQAKKEQLQIINDKEDPFYPKYLRFQKLIQLKRELIKEKQKKIEELEKIAYQSAAQEQARQEEAKSSARSKTYSPRKDIFLKNQSKNVYFNPTFNSMTQEEQLKILKTDIQSLIDEKEMLQKEAKNGTDIVASLEIFQRVLNERKIQDDSLVSENQEVKLAKIGQDENKLVSELKKENKSLMDQQRKIELSYKKIVETLKSQQQLITQLKQKMLSASQTMTMSQDVNSQRQDQSDIQPGEDNLSNANVSHLSQKEQTEALEQQIEERLKKKLEAEYRVMKQELEKKAREGMRQREEVIEKMKKQLKLNMQQIEELKTQTAQATNNYSGVQKELEKVKNGEELFKQQFSTLKLENEKIWSKYEQELVQRKRLHNIIEDMKGKIRVFCRVRPINQQEKSAGHIPVVTIVDHFTVKIKLKVNERGSIGQDDYGGRMSGYQEKEFTYDACFGPRSTQDDIFEDAKMLLQSSFDGYNVCMFAYGQTGSGKTYTIQGHNSNQGIVPRAIQELFAIKSRMEKNDRYRVSFQCYMVELYCNNLIDLLFDTDIGIPRPKLDIKEDPQNGMVFVHNLNKIDISSMQEASAIYDKGIKNRKVHSTEMNAVSSRSHVIFSVVVETINNDTNQKSKGKISFVDLAGSERMDKSNPNVSRLKEMNSINTSLKALGDVIQNLSNGSHRSHIPYRNNKLTHLMKDSIGGNSKTLMFVNIAPTDYDSQESKMSLFFGDRVKLIQNEAQKNTESQEISKLKEENDYLRRHLAQSQTMKTATTKNNTQGK